MALPLIRDIARCTVVYILASPLSIAWASIPKGFEHLDDPAIAYMQMFFHQKNLGLYKVKFINKKIKIHDSIGLLKKLPIKSNKIAEIKSILQHAIPLDRRQRCIANIQKCTDKKTTLKLFYSPSLQHIIIWINPNYQISPNEDLFIHKPRSKLGWLNATQYLANKNITFTTNQLRNDGYISYHNTNIYYDNISTSTEHNTEFHSRFYSLNLNTYIKTYILQAGYLQSFGYGFLQSTNLAGIGLKTTTRTLKDKTSSNSAPIEIYLPSPGSVAIYRGERLLSTKFYNAGNQTLDTRELPAGAYPIRIVTNPGLANENTRLVYFTKDLGLPSIRFPQYSLYIGGVENDSINDDATLLPRVTPLYLIQGQYNRRVMEHTAVNLGASVASDGEFITQLGVLYKYHNIGVDVDTMLAAHNTQAISLNQRLRFKNIYNIISASRTWSKYNSIGEWENNNFNDNNPFTQVLADNYKISDALGFKAHKIQYSLQASYQRNSSAEELLFYGATISRLFLLGQNSRIKVSAQYSHYNSEWTAQVGLNYSMSLPRHRVMLTSNYIHEENKNSFAGQAGYEFYNTSRDKTEQRLSISGAKSQDSSTIRSRATLVWPKLYSHVQMQNTKYSEEKWRNIYNMEIDSGFVFSPPYLSLGLSRNTEAGTMVIIKSRFKHKFRIKIDGQTKKILTKKYSFIRLSPFYNYRLNLEQLLENKLASYTKTDRTFSLLPGSVQQEVFTVQNQYIFIGQAVGGDGKAISGATIKNSMHHSRTESDGYFQAELSSDQAINQLTLIKGNLSCTIQVPFSDKSIIDLGRVPCK